nr:sensor histidine kinase [Kordiimonas marina]
MAYVGFLLAVSLYTMLLAFWHAGESYYYVSFVMLATMAFRYLMTDGIIWIFFPDMAFTTLLRLEYITSFMVVPGYYALAYGLFPKESSRLLLVFLVALGAAGCAMALWAPTPVMFAFRNPYFSLGAVTMVIVLATFLKARLNKRDGASIALAGHVAIMISVALDTLLYAHGRPSGAEHVPLASLLFAFLLMWLFTLRYRKERTERRALSSQLRVANEALNVRAGALDKAQGDATAALAMKASFLANISHEIRTPLNAIIGFADLLLTQSHAPADVEKQREYLRLIHNNGQHLLTLMTDILSVSDLEAGRFEITCTETDPCDVTDMCVGFVAPTALEKQLFVDVQCESAEMKADERLMRQAIIKVLSNAVKYSPANGVVTVRGRVVGKDYILSVIDTGPGIDKKDMPAALELFGRVEDTYTKKDSGMGLGLPLVSRFMALLGGRMDIDSIVGVGTTVTLTFPLVPPAPAGLVAAD